MNVLTMKMIEKIKNPYLVFDKNTKEVLFSNEKAKKLIGNDAGVIILKEVFEYDDIADNLAINDLDNLLVNEITDIYINDKKTNEKKLTNIYLGYFDDIKSQIFIEIQTQTDINKMFEAMQELSIDILFLVDINKNLLFFSDEHSKKLGLPKNIINFPNALIELGTVHPEDIDLYTVTSADMVDGIQRACEIRLKLSDGNFNWFSMFSVIVNDDYDQPSKILGKLKNIQKEKDIEFKMSHDILTKTLNKISFINCVTEILHSSEETETHALYIIGIDNFRDINDKFNHKFGDELIKSIGKTLTNSVRETDIVGRISIDEFVVFISNIDSAEIMLKKANVILSKITNEFAFEDNKYTPNINIGISQFPLHGETYNELQKKADIALFNSKNEGVNISTIFSE